MPGRGRGTRQLGTFVAVGALLLLLLPAVADATPDGRTTASVRPASTPSAESSGPEPSTGSTPVWTNLTNGLSSPPTNRFAAASTWDAADNEGILFGGIGVGGGTLRTSWTFHDQVWSSATPSSPNATNLPSPRLGATMGYDAADGYAVLFGGYGGYGAGALGDTWIFSHGTWTNLTSGLGTAPGARVNGSMAYDPTLGALVLFGGRTPVQVYNDTWIFRGGAWSAATALTPNATNTPPRRFGASFAYDGALGELVLFGGLSAQTGTTFPLSDTWAYGASGWQPLYPGRSPPARSFAAFVTEPNGTDLLFGGVGVGPVLGDTWTLDGSTWTNRTAGVGLAPTARHGAAAFLVLPGAGIGYVLLFGGATGSSTVGDTWETGASALFVTGGSAAPSALDVNQSTTLAVVVFGPPGTPSFVWTNTPGGCVAADAPSIQCTPVKAGNFTIGVRVAQTGVLVGAANATIVLQVNPPPQVTSVSVAPYPYSFGSGNLTISVKATGGTGRYTYAYAGLPPGCASSNTPGLLCAPIALGTWTVNVSVTDVTNGSAYRDVSVVVVAQSPGRPNSWVTRLEGPFGIALGVVGLGLVGILLVYRRQRRRAKVVSERPRPPTAPPPAGTPPPKAPP